MESPTRRDPDTGFAEWTQRIKALQCDVDTDEQAEQQKLEEEIRKSRMARSNRRSGGVQLAGKVGTSLQNAKYDGDNSCDTGNRSDALRKLTREPPASASATSPPISGAMERKNSNSGQAANEPISLAAFMGGKATGPRLNRPAPQPDAHDPTLFEQRSLADIHAPHPIFGSGGVALPGLTSKGRSIVTREQSSRTDPEVTRGKALPSNATSFPAPAISTVGHPPASSPGKALEKNWVRERTTSTPSPTGLSNAKAPNKVSTAASSGFPGVRNRVESFHAHANRYTERTHSPASLPSLKTSKSSDRLVQRAPPTTPSKPEALRKPQITPKNTIGASISPTATSSTPPRYRTPTSRPTSVSPTITTPSLARPLQPQPRPPPAGPQVSLGKNPAPAFLKPQQQKDLTPSLSRLQGRGFVQSVVKLSGEIEAASGSSPDRAASASPKRNVVLDRWSPQATKSPSPGPSSPSPSAPLIRKAKTMETFNYTKPTPAPELSSERPKVKPVPPPKTTRTYSHSVSGTQLDSSGLSHVSPGAKINALDSGNELPLGSSNTLVSYLKTNKTGEHVDGKDGRASPRRAKTPVRDAAGVTDGHILDEFGNRSRSRSKSRSRSRGPPSASTREKGKGGSDISSGSGRPLSHPTKDRAKLRRKGTQSAISDSSKPTDAVYEARISLPDFPDGAEESSSATIDRLPKDPPEDTWRTPTNQPAYADEDFLRLKSTWNNQEPAGIRPFRSLPSSSPVISPSPTRTSFSASKAESKASKLGKALPGLVKEPSAIHDPAPPSPPVTPPLVSRRSQDRRSSPSPGRHNRIPSSGNRPTVMDVAQTFIITDTRVPLDSPVDQAPKSPLASAPTPKSPVAASFLRSRQEEDVKGNRAYDNSTVNPGGWSEDERTITPAIMKAERRRSAILEKYSNFSLPVLAEEKTPAPSPAGTLRKVDPSTLSSNIGGDSNTVSDAKISVTPTSARAVTDYKDEAVPVVNASKIWDNPPQHFKPDTDLHTVSVEVKLLEGNAAYDINRGPNNIFIFYDSENLSIVHRAKSRSSGLVTTKVWEWRGKRSDGGEKEESKAQEVARRYGTDLIRCEQYAEPQELVHVLGGILITRQGRRSIWSVENTTMHIVRSYAGLILVDEIDLNISNLCSGFSFCVSVLDTLWVWYGCGSCPAERSAALQYGQAIVDSAPEDTPKQIVEMEEGQEDEMFWMFLGEDGYARASYWKWRKGERGEPIGPRIFKINADDKGSEVAELETFPPPAQVSSMILVLHLAYEVFVLVGSLVRSQRKNIKLGLTLAQDLSAHTARTKPFRPPVHVLIFPSRIPLDLKAAMRGLDEDAIHGDGTVPEHMNLVTADDAWDQLRRREWAPKDLSDENMLPLGLTP